MPRKKPGYHNLHVKITKTNFRVLQEYCNSGVERISASQILDLFLKHYVEEYIKPRMQKSESASWTALKHDLPRATALVAHRIEPTEFDAPGGE